MGGAKIVWATKEPSQLGVWEDVHTPPPLWVQKLCIAGIQILSKIALGRKVGQRYGLYYVDSGNIG